MTDLLDAPSTASAAPLSRAPLSAGLPPLVEQAERLVSLGLVPDGGASLTPDGLRSAARALEATAPAGSLLVVHPQHLPPSVLAPHLRLPVTTRGRTVEREGFVVVDMGDVDDFAPVPGVEVPDADVYAVAGLDRGDDLVNRSPEEAQPELAARGRTPLTLAEGIHWVLQAPSVLERTLCFMTIGSRLRRPDGTFDARTPAVWISNGTGRDGRERRGAPKVGWCWWRNRHTWLGFASATGRVVA
jgi:hypothetical protein